MGKRFATYQDYRNAWAAAYTSDPEIPLNIDIELASTCNLACPFCFWGESDFNTQMMGPAADGRTKKRLMPTELALKIIDEAAALGVPALKFNWRGESTMHPDYSKILRYAADKTEFYLFPDQHAIDMVETFSSSGYHQKAFFDLLVNTNANCKDHAIDGLMAATKVMVSLDSCVPETYAKMRVGGTLPRAFDVIRELLRRQHPNLWIRRVITKENAHERFAEDVHAIFGGTGYKVSEHHCVDRSTDSSHQTNNPDRYERTYCGYPSQRLMVASDGTVFPCCVDYNAEMPMGNVQKESLLEIWNGETFKTLRADLRAGVFRSAACKSCTSWMSYKAPQREQVQDKEVVVTC